ncbi:MAG: hypothetical protein MUE38_09285 [Flavihumibacter sp.]|jgi:hypothetical protein|nr:hypothetical protein [Flavihumibacter sp.]
MKQILFVPFIFISICLSGKESNTAIRILSFIPGDTLKAKKSMADTSARFSYAEVYYLRQPKNYDKIIMWVDGDDVGEKLKILISQTKYRTWALTYMGDDGWELVTTVYYVSPITADYEFYYYFKKRRK